VTRVCSIKKEVICFVIVGWPETIDPTEQQQYARFMKKIDKDQTFAAQVKSLCEVAEKCMLRNNQIDMFEEYFHNEESDHIV
jgi:dynein intermediate chain 2, axonemal